MAILQQQNEASIFLGVLSGIFCTITKKVVYIACKKNTTYCQNVIEFIIHENEDAHEMFNA